MFRVLSDCENAKEAVIFTCSFGQKFPDNRRRAEFDDVEHDGLVDKEGTQHRCQMVLQQML
jgi:hypothetical protein